MSDAIIERNRRAVYLALTGVFSDSAVLIRALELWERQFSDQRGFRVNLYVNAVAQEIVLTDLQVRALAANLYAAMTTPERSLPHLPAGLRARTAEVRDKQPTKPVVPPTDVSLQTGVVNPRLAVFTNLLAAIIEGVTRAHKFTDFLEALEGQALKVSPATIRARTIWINSGLTQLRQFANVVADGERRAIVTNAYVALCEACGPVIADRVLATAVQSIEQSPEATFCSPRSFL